MPRRLTFSRLALQKQPLFYLTISFATGILACTLLRAPLFIWITGALAGWAIAGAVLLQRSKSASAFLFAAFLFAGGALARCEQIDAEADSIKTLIESGELDSDEPVELWGRLLEMPEPAPERILLTLSVDRVATLGRVFAASGRVRLTVAFADDDERREYDRLALDYGDGVWAYCYLRRSHGYRNPGVRSFDLWLEERNLDAVGHIKSPLLIEKTLSKRSSSIFGQLGRIRASSVSAILRRIPQPSSGLLVAALFGNRHFIDRRLGEGFRAGGTFHLLVISGLHVSLIAVLLAAIIRRLTHSRTLRFVILTTIVWAYAVMVGMQPAVTRAAWMLSFAILARALWRESAGPNTLAAAALVILSLNPRELLNPAFQLSFLTVGAIVLVSGPVFQRFKAAGEWQPNERTPFPPRISPWIRSIAELLFWSERGFREQMRRSSIRYRLKKSPAALWAEKLCIQRPLRWAAATMLTTITVQIVLLPLTIRLFHRVSLAAPAANLAEGALVICAMILGALFLLAHFQAPAAEPVLISLLDTTGRLALDAAETIATPSHANLFAPDHAASEMILYPLFALSAIGLAATLDLWNPLDLKHDAGLRRKAWGAWLSLMLISGLMLVLPVSPRFERGRLSLSFLDVGQGDAIAIAFPMGSVMLVDSGGRPGFGAPMTEADETGFQFAEDRAGTGQLAVAPFLWHYGVKRIDWAVASHNHADHVEGFSELARLFRLGTLVSATVEPVSPFDTVVERRAVRHERWSRGDRIEIEGVSIEVLAPVADREPGKTPMQNSPNERSLVLRLRFGHRSFLLTGDLEKHGERLLAALGEDLSADVLKVAHHGSRTSSTPDFLALVEPVVAVVSAGSPSPFGHPHTDVMSRIRGTGARVLTTGACGAITISTNGDDLQVNTFTKCE
ncbi:MAG: ComEC/Rec2 family competence protein [Blastocatellales bacterium]|nr:ComEC/Rec2 family competence protein [Blastocatellales bacterium]